MAAPSRLRLIREWRSVVKKLVEAVGEACPDAEVYLFGGAAEGRLTALSDIDVAVVSRRCSPARIWEELEEKGVPNYYPLDIVVLSSGELEKLRGTKIRLA